MFHPKEAVLEQPPLKDEILTWEDTYAIAFELKRKYPGINLEEVSLRMIYDWTKALPEFQDDPELANDTILSSIYQEWYEEVNRL